MAFRAPSLQAGDPYRDSMGVLPAPEFDWQRWLQSPGTQPSPTDEEFQRMTRQVAEREFASVVNRRREALERLRELGTLAPNASPLQSEITERNALDNNIKTLTEVQEKLARQIQATGGSTSNVLVPLMTPEGRPSGFALNPNNLDGAPINLDSISPDQRSRVLEGQLGRNAAADRSREATERTNTTAGASRHAADQMVVRQKEMADAARAVAQANHDATIYTADARILEQQMKSGDKTLEEYRQLADQLNNLRVETQKGINTIATEAVKGMNEAEVEYFKGAIEWDKIGQLARDSFQDALSNRATAIADQDKEAYKSQMAQDIARDTAAATLAGKLYEDYLKSLEGVHNIPEGWFNAMSRAAQSSAYAKLKPGLMSQLTRPEADPNKLGEIFQQVRGMFGPTRQPNFRELPAVAPEFQRAPLPSLQGAVDRNLDIFTQARQGTLLPVPASPENPLSPDFQGAPDIRAAVPRTDWGSFAAPTAGGPPESDLFPEPQLTPIDLSPIPEPDYPSFNPEDLLPTGGGEGAFGAPHDPDADLAFWEPILSSAPPEFVPLTMNVMAGLAARDDLEEDPERVLREEIDYAFGPFGFTYDLSSPYEEDPYGLGGGLYAL